MAIHLWARSSVMAVHLSEEPPTSAAPAGSADRQARVTGPLYVGHTFAVPLSVVAEESGGVVRLGLESTTPPAD